jgi:hypothetical protein
MNFKNWILNEELWIDRNFATVFHRTASTKNIEAILNGGWKVGQGDMYGSGLYTTFSVDSQLNKRKATDSPATMHETYGVYILKFKLDNIRRFLVFEKSIADQMYPNGSTLKDQFRRLQVPLSATDMEYVNEAQKMMDIAGSNSPTNLTSSKAAHYLVKNINLPQKVPGIMFYGPNDGHVCVIYPPYTKLTLIAYTRDNGKATDASQLQWSSIRLFNRNFDKDLLKPTQELQAKNLPTFGSEYAPAGMPFPAKTWQRIMKPGGVEFFELFEDLITKYKDTGLPKQALKLSPELLPNIIKAIKSFKYGKLEIGTSLFNDALNLYINSKPDKQLSDDEWKELIHYNIHEARRFADPEELTKLVDKLLTAKPKLSGYDIVDLMHLHPHPLELIKKLGKEQLQSAVDVNRLVYKWSVNPDEMLITQLIASRDPSQQAYAGLIGDNEKILNAVINAQIMTPKLALDVLKSNIENGWESELKEKWKDNWKKAFNILKPYLLQLDEETIQNYLTELQANDVSGKKASETLQILSAMMKNKNISNELHNQLFNVSKTMYNNSLKQDVTSESILRKIFNSKNATLRK